LKKELDLRSYQYELPEELIAQRPLKDRASSRMLVLEKDTGKFYEKSFSEFPGLIDSKYLIVRNNTRVRKARLYGKKKTGANVEIFLLDRKDENIWETLARPGRRLKIGVEIDFPESMKATILEDFGEGKRLVKFEPELTEDYIERYGEIPLPPYIKEKIEDPDRYQTIYSRKTNSSAAPTGRGPSPRRRIGRRRAPPCGRWAGRDIHPPYPEDIGSFCRTHREARNIFHNRSDHIRTSP